MPSFRCVGCQTTYEERLAWCWYCGGPSLIIPAGHRPPSPLDRHVEVTTARDLVRRRWSAVTSTAYPALRLAPGALVVAYGEPGAGKSTWLARWLDGFPQPVLLAAAEEHVGPAVGGRLSRLAIRREDYYVLAGGGVGDLLVEATTRHVAAVGVDSVTVTTLTPEDLRRLIGAAGLAALLATLQVTKAGVPAGSNRLLHEADVVVEVAGGEWRVVKSRFQPTGVRGLVLPLAEEVVDVR